ncbi:MFS transporter [soil metagenome]
MRRYSQGMPFERYRVIPLIVAFPLFLQNLDTSVMATALPSIADSLQVNALHLNIAITSYLLSLAVFLPLAGWLAERFGARRVFCGAIIFFSLGSALCGAATSLPQLVAFRMVQGMGGALMVPVGRLILLHSIPKSRMVSAMVWFTVPGVIGRMAGPLVGGLIVTITSWRWIFLVNIPFCILGVGLALMFIDKTHERSPQPFDFAGFIWLALGLAGLLGGLETAGKGLLPDGAAWVLAGLGALSIGAYWLHSRKRAEPIIDPGILRYPSYWATVVGGTPLRIAIGASPFLLPLMLQLGFGLSAMDSGLLTVATSIGALATRTVVAASIRRFGFKPLLLGCTCLTSLVYMSYALFRPDTPHVLIFCVLMVGGLFNSMCMVALNAMGYSEIPRERMSHAATLAAMSQQLSVALGVTLGASLVTLTNRLHGGDASQLAAADFSPAFVVVGLMTLSSLFFFGRLRKEEGSEMNGG